MILKLREPDRLTEVIPTAKKFTFKGKEFVAVPHKLDETRVLNNLGFKAPSPILGEYDWPGRFTPYKHQRETAGFLTLHRKCLVLNEIGTGKTQSALWAADWMMKQGLIKRVLIISPLSTLEAVWGDSIFAGFPRRTYSILYGSAERRMDRMAEGSDFDVVNHDGFSIISKAAMNQYDLVIVDEAAVYRNPTTTRFRLLNKWLSEQPEIRLWLMTGTPTPNAPTDAFSLARLVDSPNCKMTYTAFRNRTMVRHGPYRWIPRFEASDIVHHAMTPSIRFSRDECFDLPSTVLQSRKVELTKEQNKHYSKMMKDFITEAKEGTITAQNEAIRIQKMLQIAAGVAYNDKSERVVLDCSPRIKLVESLIEQAGGKVLVFAPLRGVLDMLVEKLRKRWTTALVHGGISKGKRTMVFRDFQQEKDPQVLVAHPGTMAHGLTLTEASTIVWYGPLYSNEIYTQANGRVERIGKKLSSTVIHIEGTGLEHEVYARLQGKQKLQGVLLDMVRDAKL